MLKFSNYLRPYWSRQHGAYLTMIVSWLIAVMLSHYYSWMQLIILIFILSALNFMELSIEGISRKTSLPSRKKLWLAIYSLISFSLAVLLLLKLNSILYVLPVLLVFSLVFIVLTLQKKQKSALAEWLSFATFSLAGLLAFNPKQDPQAGEYLVLGIIMSAYFGLSIFLVKARLLKLPLYSPLLYTAIVIIVLILWLRLDAFTFMLSALLIVKALQPLVLNSWYGKLKIKWIGLIEMAYHLVFLLLLLYFSATVLSYPERFNGL